MAVNLVLEMPMSLSLWSRASQGTIGRVTSAYYIFGHMGSIKDSFGEK
jgi:hypothetical protein